MSSIIEKYNHVYKKVKAVSDEIEKLQEQIASLQNGAETNIPARREHLEEQVRKIDDYILKVQAFRHLAEKHISSKNLLTIEAPENYRVNLNRLRKWAMMIDPKEKTDPMESDDPYAQKVYLVATCDEFFLNKKRKEFVKKIEELKTEETVGIASDINRKRTRIVELKEEQKKYFFGQEFIDFLQDVKQENLKYWNEKTPEFYTNQESDNQVFAPGAYSLMFPIEKEYREYVKNQLGKFYDETGSRILLPVEISLEKEFVMTVSCAPSKDRTLDKGIQNIILNIINNSKAGMQKVYVVDGVRFNTSSVGTLKAIENTFALERIPRNEEQITETLEKIVSSFADIDEKIGDYDSVKSYNRDVEDDQKITLKTIILYGWPNAYSGRNQDLLKRIMTNYERYGVSLIAIEYKKKDDLKQAKKSALPEYATYKAIHIRNFTNDSTIELPEQNIRNFVWYVFNDVLANTYIASVMEHKIESKAIGSQYVKRYSLDNIPPYERGKKSILLPFGVDAKDQAHSISFDNENFASYLMGASGSGKSTLLHTLITGIIRNYHPDDVELWLADFKMSEFAQYMDPMPPHIKYILLDESPELVYDLLDKLTEKMMERQRFFMRHKELKKVENVKDTYMPVILVILDEFSIMSQAVADSQAYTLKLQNLLAKGRALGIKFIFASQDFSKGIRGLTSTAKDQIQSRMAMKNTYSEIDQTLELSSNMKTEMVRNWMEAIPPYYVLMKYRDGEYVRVKRVNVMYFEGKDEDAYKPQRKMIERINSSMKVTEKYLANDNNSYVNKYPVVVDGNSFKPFEERAIREQIQCRQNMEDFSGDEVFVFAGKPRLMSEYKEFVVTPESRQNFLLLCDSSASSCGMSVMTSIMTSFKMQDRAVEIWAYERNKIYKYAHNTIWACENIITGIENICDCIKILKDKLQNQDEMTSKLIVLLGFENICADFELLDGYQKNHNHKNLAIESLEDQVNSITVDISKESAEEAAERNLFMQNMMEIDLSDDFSSMMDADDIESLFKTLSQSKEVSEESTELDKTQTVELADDQETNIEPLNDVEKTQLYNAKADLKYIVQQGSRKGIHFLLYLNTYSDLRQTGLKEEFFKHRLSFRIPSDDSKAIFGNASASNLPEHICMYSDRLEQFSFRPYLHRGITWDGWGVDENGEVINPLELE